MRQASTHLSELGEPASSGPKFGRFLILPILAIAYTEIVSPLLLQIDLGPRLGSMWTAAQMQVVFAPRLEHKIFWPVMAAISLLLTARNWSRLTIPPHIIVLFMYLALAGVSVLWALKPEFASVRFLQQAMIIASIVLPALLAPITANMMRGVFLCYAFILFINIGFVIVQEPLVLDNMRVCYPGYFVFKGDLGQCAAFALLLSLHEILYPGWRRVFGVIVIGIAIYLVVLSDSKGSFSVALVAPLLAALTLFIGKKMRASSAMVLLAIPICYAALSGITGNLINRISWHLFGNYDLSGRTAIWDFANFEIARKPLLGWGYQSFWLVGPDAPSITDAPGWIKSMPNAHNGYLDTAVDLGYVGLALFIIFIFATLHAIGRVADRDPARAWLLLTIALFLIIVNFLESGWMRGMDRLWLMFLLVAAEIGRYWQALPPGVSEPGCREPAIGELPIDIARAQRSDKFG
jgi:exopolysaccharide production protein ExoQ